MDNEALRIFITVKSSSLQIQWQIFYGFPQSDYFCHDTLVFAAAYFTD
jgi:hypothetical protein